MVTIVKFRKRYRPLRKMQVVLFMQYSQSIYSACALAWSYNYYTCFKSCNSVSCSCHITRTILTHGCDRVNSRGGCINCFTCLKIGSDRNSGCICSRNSTMTALLFSMSLALYYGASCNFDVIVEISSLVLVMVVGVRVALSFLTFVTGILPIVLANG